MNFQILRVPVRVFTETVEYAAVWVNLSNCTSNWAIQWWLFQPCPSNSNKLIKNVPCTFPLRPKLGRSTYRKWMDGCTFPSLTWLFGIDILIQCTERKWMSVQFCNLSTLMKEANLVILVKTELERINCTIWNILFIPINCWVRYALDSMPVDRILFIIKKRRLKNVL